MSMYSGVHILTKVSLMHYLQPQTCSDVNNPSCWINSRLESNKDKIARLVLSGRYVLRDATGFKSSTLGLRVCRSDLRVFCR